jgi:hypothetical protein
VSGKPRRPVLHLIACDAEPARDLEPLIRSSQHLGWDVYVIATPAGAKLPDRGALAEMTGHPVCEDDQLEPLYPLPPAGAYAVAPASFDVINKWAYGNNDGLALRLLNEATGLGLPIVVVPTPGPALARHPAFMESIDRLRAWGVIVEFDPGRYPLPGADPNDADPFPWQAAERVIARWTRFARIPVPGAYQEENPEDDRDDLTERKEAAAGEVSDLALLAPKPLPLMPLAS